MSRTLSSLLLIHELFQEITYPRPLSWDSSSINSFKWTSQTLSRDYTITNSSMWIPRTLPSQTQQCREHSIPYVLPIHELFNETTLSRTLSCEYHELYHLRPINIERIHKRPSHVENQYIGFDSSLPRLLLVVSQYCYKFYPDNAISSLPTLVNDQYSAILLVVVSRHY